MQPLDVIVVDNREESIGIVRHPDPMIITTKELGQLLANSDSDWQAEVLFQWAQAVDRWPAEAATAQRKGYYSWPMQCRFIVEHLSSDNCSSIAGVLESLTEHLRAVIVERLQAEPPYCPPGQH